jgi:hypothetical protein
MTIELALADASNNCVREDAMATITLRSGVRYTGKLKKRPSDLGSDTRLLELSGGGWVGLRVEEIAAVESHR